MRVSLFLCLVVLCFSSCKGDGKIFANAGGKLSYGISSPILTQNLQEVSDHNTQMVFSQVFEGLISLQPQDLSLQPQLAESFTVKDNGLSYEFVLRKGVYFIHPDGSKELFKPSDVLYSIKKACASHDSIESRAYSLVFKNNLVGADDYFHKKSNSISGVKIKGNTVILTLIRRDNNFLSRLTLPLCAIVSEKFDKESDELCGTGPFMLPSSNFKKNEILLLKNEHYYQKDKNGCQLPYLDSLAFVVNSSKIELLNNFELGKTQIITGLPTNKITKMLEGRLEDFNSEPPLFILHNNPQLVSNYYVFNLKDERFKDVRVRQAFNYAINRQKIGQVILRNQYFELGSYGVVPPVRNFYRGYDFDGVRKNGYYFNPEKARQLLAEAGYPDGKQFGSVNIRFNIDDIHAAVADEISAQLSNTLGINVTIDGSNFTKLTADCIKGEGDLFRYAWAADYSSPESFLMNFYGKFAPKNPSQPSPLNVGRFVNAEFDNIMDKARSESNLVKRRSFYSEAEKLLISQAPIIPLWYSGDIQISYSKVRNIHFNPLEQYSFKEVYLKEWTKAEYLQLMKK
ncbi:MAG: peptide ABC transporter substrate-binding protein [Bacteroidetes bacterium]|nr:peptide ABC transporter substrate-binding protein [Bacteroidota bacterium]